VADLIANPLTDRLRSAPMPARPKNRQLDVTISPWRSRSTERMDEVTRRLLPGWRSRYRDRRQVDVVDGAGLTFVRFYVTVDPASRDMIEQGAYLPAPSLMERIPFGTYLRVARHAIALADEGHLRFELRNGQLRRITEDEASIVLGPLPPRQEHYREPRKQREKRVELDQVAAIYRDPANARSPVKAVRLALGVSERTAHRRVEAAREAGLIPPLRTGVASGRERPKR
jgi:hypothetical protein